MARTPKKQPTLLTKRLRLRPFRGSDLPAMHQLYGDADNLRYWSVEASPNLAHTRKSLRWHLAYRPQHYVMWAPSAWSTTIAATCAKNESMSAG
jgi:[ribosomal protein S5]-alanine N-acetyltransferase